MEFEALYKEFSPKIFRLCLGYVNDSEKAKDITQETFITVWQHLPAFKQQSGIGTWVYKIAVNKCLRQLENDSKVIPAKLPSSLLTPDFDDNTMEERLIFLRKCISDLPEMDRLVIGLFLENVSQEKIAEITGISHSNVRVKIHRIKEKLLQKFKSDGTF